MPQIANRIGSAQAFKVSLTAPFVALSLALLMALLFTPQLAIGSSKSADDLAELCNSDSVAAKSRCLGYIQGYLDAINAKEIESSSWSERAIDTRIGTKLRVRYDDKGTPVCIDNDSEAAMTLKVKILTSAQEGSGTAAAWIEALARSEFPCK